MIFIALVFDGSKVEKLDESVQSIIEGTTTTNTSFTSELDKINALLDRVNTLLNNPLVQKIFFKEPITTAQPQENMLMKNKKAEAIYSFVLQTLEQLKNNKPEMTIQELHQEFIKNKEMMIQTLSRVV